MTRPKNAQMAPPERMGRVRLSSSDPTSAESWRQMIVKKNAICDVPIASATAEMTPVTTDTAPNFRKKVGVREGENGMEGGSSPRGASTVQKPNAMSAPVTAAAMQPASDLRLANGRGTRMFVRGTRNEEGSGGVRGPYIRPKSEAVVSHQDKLFQNMLLIRHR